MTQYTLLAIVCGLCTYMWRSLGVAVSERIRPDSPLFAWIGCVAFAMLAGLISRILLLPSGTLEQTALWQRLAATAVAVIAYFFLTRKNLFVGVIASALAMYLILVASGQTLA